MLSLFRSRYPKGSLTGELLAIEHGKYIVKVFVQVEGITLATGLAASDILEQAEDAARIRALSALNLDATAITTSSPEKLPAVEQPQSIQPSAEVLQPNLREATQEPDLSVQPISSSLSGEQVRSPSQSSFNGNPKAQSNSASINGGVAAQIEVSQPPETDEVTSPKTTEQPLNLFPISESSDNEPLLPSIAIVPETAKPAKASKTQKASRERVTDPTQAKKAEATQVEEPTPPVKLPEPPELLEEITPIKSQDEPEVTEPSNLPIDIDREMLNEPPIEEPVTETSEPDPTSEPLDFSEIIARSNAQLKRLGWTNEEGRDYLLKTYGKKSRQLLNDQELLQFLHYLESLPTP